MSADTTTAPPAAAEASAPTQLTMAGALNAALRDAMAADDRVIVYGEDVGPLGGVFRVTDGLQAQFGEDRIWDSPLAESGIIGTAIGMAMYGMRPVVEMQFDAFSYPAFEQMVSHVAKMRNRTKGRVTLPMVVRIPCAGAIGGVEHHSDSSEAYWTSTPGLTVVMPSNPADAYSMLREAIDSDDPVVFMEPKSRYWSKAPLALPVTTAPMDRAEVVARGHRRDAHRLRPDRAHRARGGRRRSRSRGSRSRSSTCAASRPSTTRRSAHPYARRRAPP